MVDRCKIELHLHRLTTPSGEVPLSVLAEVAKHINDLALRLARQIVDATGAGRTPKTVERAAQLSLVGLGKGSTKLHLAGPERQQETFPEWEEFDVNLELFEAINDVFDQLAHDRVPELSSPAHDSLRSLLLVFDDRRTDHPIDLSIQTEIPGRPAHRTRLPRNSAFRDVINPPALVAETLFELAPTTTKAIGRLYSLDLNSGLFRIEDDIKSSIALTVPEDDRDDVSRLVGQQVVVEGHPQFDERGRLKRITDPRVMPSSLPTGLDWKQEVTDIGELLDGAEPYDPDDPGLEDLTDAEFDAFLDAINS